MEKDLYMNSSKYFTMVLSESTLTLPCTTKVYWQFLEQVRTFMYLGSLFASERKCVNSTRYACATMYSPIIRYSHYKVSQPHGMSTTRYVPPTNNTPTTNNAPTTRYAPPQTIPLPQIMPLLQGMPHHKLRN